MEYVLVSLGGYMVGSGAYSLWTKGYSRDMVLVAVLGFIFAIWGVTY